MPKVSEPLAYFMGDQPVTKVYRGKSVQWAPSGPSGPVRRNLFPGGRLMAPGEFQAGYASGVSAGTGVAVRCGPSDIDAAQCFSWKQTDAPFQLGTCAPPEALYANDVPGEVPPWTSIFCGPFQAGDLVAVRVDVGMSTVITDTGAQATTQFMVPGWTIFGDNFSLPVTAPPLGTLSDDDVMPWTQDGWQYSLIASDADIAGEGYDTALRWITYGRSLIIPPEWAVECPGEMFVTLIFYHISYTIKPCSARSEIRNVVIEKIDPAIRTTPISRNEILPAFDGSDPGASWDGVAYESHSVIPYTRSLQG